MRSPVTHLHVQSFARKTANKRFLQAKRYRKNMAGAMLLEALISIVIFAFGILGLIGMQTISTANSMNAQERSVAALLASDLVSQMWIRGTSTVGSGSLAADVASWQTKVQNSMLTNATTNVTASNGLATITITWKSTSKRNTDNVSRYQTMVYVQ